MRDVTTSTRRNGPTAVWRHSSIGVGRSGVPLSGDPNALQAWVNDLRRSIAWEREGVESSVAVQQIAALSFVVNGKVDGNAITATGKSGAGDVTLKATR